MTDLPADPLTGFGRRMVANMSWLTLSQGIGLAVSVMTISLLGRALTTEEWAAFGVGVIQILGVGLTISDPGLTTTLVRDISQSPDRTSELVGQTLGLRLALAVVTIGLIVLYAWLELAGPARLAALVVSVVMVTQALATPVVVLQAKVLVKQGISIEIANRVTGFACMALAVFGGLGFAGVLGGLIVGELVGLAVLYFFVSRLVSIRPVISWPAWRARLRLSLTLAGASILSVAVVRAGFFMLSNMATLEQTADYTSANRITALLERIPQLALATLFPVMSSLSVHDVPALVRLYYWGLLRAAALAIAMVVVGWPLASTILLWLAGESHVSATPALQWLIVYTALLCVAVVAGNMLVVLHETRVSLGIWVVIAPVCVGLNWLWIPRWGAAGAAMATSVAMALALVASVIAARWKLARL